MIVFVANTLFLVNNCLFYLYPVVICNIIYLFSFILGLFNQFQNSLNGIISPGGGGGGLTGPNAEHHTEAIEGNLKPARISVQTVHFIYTLLFIFCSTFIFRSSCQRPSTPRFCPEYLCVLTTT